jgi:uncharacterized membrane protein
MLNRFADSFQRRWLSYIVGMLLIYSSLPLLAPILKAIGLNSLAQVIYLPYKGMCHTYGFRSFYLFGDQIAYSRNEFEQKTGINTSTAGGLFAARDFQGNESVGYKIAICQRDMAIYPAMAIGGIIYGLSRKRIQKMPWWLFLLLGIAPIGIDGFSQLLSQPPLNFFQYRESVWQLRVLTGALFGFSVAWLIFPLLSGTVDTTTPAPSTSRTVRS